MKRQNPICRTAPNWIARRLQDKAALAPLTGQDWPALQAFLHLVALYGQSDALGRAHALHAMRHAVQAMQPSTRHLAKAGIPHALDWEDEDRIWSAITPATCEQDITAEREAHARWSTKILSADLVRVETLANLREVHELTPADQAAMRAVLSDRQRMAEKLNTHSLSDREFVTPRGVVSN